MVTQGDGNEVTQDLKRGSLTTEHLAALLALNWDQGHWGSVGLQLCVNQHCLFSFPYWPHNA